MSVPTFIQNSRIGRVIYQIRDGHLQISASKFGRGFNECRLALRSLNPNYTPRFVRLYALLVIPFVLALLCGVVIRGLFHQTLIRQEALIYIYQWPVTFGVVFLILAIRGIRRVEFFEFRNHWGKPVLHIIRERKQAAECAAFITVLVAHIELAQSDLPPEERTKLLRQLVDDSTGASGLRPGQDKWKVSIGLGVLAVVFPLVPAVNYSSDPSLFPIIFLLCVGGAGFSIFSFLAKEPRRWWSVLGLVLSLIPAYFY